jgi:hypothetical protein
MRLFAWIFGASFSMSFMFRCPTCGLADRVKPLLSATSSATTVAASLQ